MSDEESIDTESIYAKLTRAFEEQKEDPVTLVTIIDMYGQEINEDGSIDEKNKYLEHLCSLLNDNPHILREISWDLPKGLLEFLSLENIDVHKRLADSSIVSNVMKCFNEIAINGNPKECLLAACELPVSYTHLDVYKRQTFIDDTPQLFKMVSSQNRAQKLLHYLADLAVNGSSIKGQVGIPQLKKVPDIPHIHDAQGNVIDVTNVPPPAGWRQVLLEQGPEEFAKQVRQFQGTLLMDTTWRDAHQSLLATRVRTHDLAKIAPTTAHALASAFALECWGGATFDVAMRFLHEDPWKRLRTLRKLVPNIPFQMLLRGANGVASVSYTHLDVYKRQPDSCSLTVWKTNVVIRKLHNQTTSNVINNIIGLSQMIKRPVSTTNSAASLAKVYGGSIRVS